MSEPEARDIPDRPGEQSIEPDGTEEVEENDDDTDDNTDDKRDPERRDDGDGDMEAPRDRDD
jgi:hypothetical protein